MKPIIAALLLLLVSPSVQSQVLPKDLEAPSFDDLQWVTGGITSNDLKGSNVVLEFWSTTCGSCIKSIGHINELAGEFGKDLRFVSVSLDKKVEPVKKFLAKTEIRTPVCIGTQDFRDAFGGSWIPRTVIIDKEGMVRWTGRPGQLTGEILKQFIETNTVPEPLPKREFLLISVKEAAETTDNTSVRWSNDPPYMMWYCKELSMLVSWLVENINLRDKPEVIFEGEIPLEPRLDVEMQLDSTKSEFQMYQATLDALQQSFGFSYRYEFRKQPTWILKVKNLSKLAAVQNLDASYEDGKYEETETEIVLKNHYIDRLIDILASHFDKKIKCFAEVPGFFDISFPKDDFQKARRHLFQQYGIEIVEQPDVLTKVCIVSFPEKKVEKDI